MGCFGGRHRILTPTFKGVPDLQQRTRRVSDSSATSHTGNADESEGPRPQLRVYAGRSLRPEVCAQDMADLSECWDAVQRDKSICLRNFMQQATMEEMEEWELKSWPTEGRFGKEARKRILDWVDSLGQSGKVVRVLQQSDVRTLDSQSLEQNDRMLKNMEYRLRSSTGPSRSLRLSRSRQPSSVCSGSTVTTGTGGCSLDTEDDDLSGRRLSIASATSVSSRVSMASVSSKGSVRHQRLQRAATTEPSEVDFLLTLMDDADRRRATGPTPPTLPIADCLPRSGLLAARGMGSGGQNSNSSGPNPHPGAPAPSRNPGVRVDIEDDEEAAAAKFLASNQESMNLPARPEVSPNAVDNRGGRSAPPRRRKSATVRSPLGNCNRGPKRAVSLCALTDYPDMDRR
eukprot:TRINITY_DN3391_c0_g1_i1.p1 TRINITY_DN3391_c0_g1~~TRINITY_DN3391_c0_g1_i1.p1  ORF type:complete len:401 (+),score=-2.04 TRINITY_DN3391_c0_g1_i1:48-1250(+)